MIEPVSFSIIAVDPGETTGYVRIRTQFEYNKLVDVEFEDARELILKEVDNYARFGQLMFPPSAAVLILEASATKPYNTSGVWAHGFILGLWGYHMGCLEVPDELKTAFQAHTGVPFGYHTSLQPKAKRLAPLCKWHDLLLKKLDKFKVSTHTKDAFALCILGIRGIEEATL